MEFYVYTLADPKCGSVFYVGKGKGRRAYDHTELVRRGKSSGNLRKDERIKAILACGSEPVVAIVARYENEADAYEHERELIALTSGLANALAGYGWLLTREEAAHRAALREELRVKRECAPKLKHYVGLWNAIEAAGYRLTIPGVRDGDGMATLLRDTCREMLAALGADANEYWAEIGNGPIKYWEKLGSEAN